MAADRILVQELIDYAKYDKLLEWQRLIPWINNFAQKKVKGTFNAARAEKALADYVFNDAYVRYQSGGRKLTWGKGAPRTDKETKMLFGKKLLQYLMPRINSTAKRMKEKGLVKGKLVKKHPTLGR